MIPALARWNGDHAMTKDTTKEAAEALFFDDWYDAIEEGVRDRRERPGVRRSVAWRRRPTRSGALA
jgi:hypothetical protein